MSTGPFPRIFEIHHHNFYRVYGPKLDHDLRIFRGTPSDDTLVQTPFMQYIG
jgi:hypothetical protein